MNIQTAMRVQVRNRSLQTYGMKGTVKWVTCGLARVQLDNGQRRDYKLDNLMQVKVESGKLPDNEPVKQTGTPTLMIFSRGIVIDDMESLREAVDSDESVRGIARSLDEFLMHVSETYCESITSIITDDTMQPSCIINGSTLAVHEISAGEYQLREIAVKL